MFQPKVTTMNPLRIKGSKEVATSTSRFCSSPPCATGGRHALSAFLRCKCHPFATLNRGNRCSSLPRCVLAVRWISTFFAEPGKSCAPLRTEASLNVRVPPNYVARLRTETSARPDGRSTLRASAGRSCARRLMGGMLAFLAVIASPEDCFRLSNYRLHRPSKKWQPPSKCSRELLV